MPQWPFSFTHSFPACHNIFLVWNNLDWNFSCHIEISQKCWRLRWGGRNIWEDSNPHQRLSVPNPFNNNAPFIEKPSLSICSANQLIGFDMKDELVFNNLANFRTTYTVVADIMFDACRFQCFFICQIYWYTCHWAWATAIIS